MRGVIIGYMQVDMLNKDNMGIDGDEHFKSEIQEYISNQMTEDAGYLNVIYLAQSNGASADDYNKTEISKSITEPFCIEKTDGYAIDLDLVKQAPIPRYLIKTTNFDIFDDRIEVRPYRVEGEYVAHVMERMPTFNTVMCQNVAMGFPEYEVIGAWPHIALLDNVRKMLDRDAVVYIRTDLIKCDSPWKQDLEDTCAYYIQTGLLHFI